MMSSTAVPGISEEVRVIPNKSQQALGPGWLRGLRELVAGGLHCMDECGQRHGLWIYVRQGNPDSAAADFYESLKRFGEYLDESARLDYKALESFNRTAYGKQ